MGFFCSVFQCIKLKKYTAKKYMTKLYGQKKFLKDFKNWNLVIDTITSHWI